MRHRIAVVEQNPLALAIAFFMEEGDACFFELFLNIVHNSAYLRRRICRANDEIIVCRHQPTHIHRNDVTRLFLIRRLADGNAFFLLGQILSSYCCVPAVSSGGNSS